MGDKRVEVFLRHHVRFAFRHAFYLGHGRLALSLGVHPSAFAARRSYSSLDSALALGRLRDRRSGYSYVQALTSDMWERMCEGTRSGHPCTENLPTTLPVASTDPQVYLGSMALY